MSKPAVITARLNPGPKADADLQAVQARHGLASYADAAALFAGLGIE